MIPPHASAGSAERYPSAYGLSAAVCQALRAAFIPRRMRCLWAAGLAAALAANPYVLNDGQSLLMSSMGIACSASLLCGTILLCLKYRFTAYVLLPAIILFNAGLYMMQMRYGLVLNLSVLSSMAETNFQEACAFCTPASIAGTLLLAGFIYLAIYWSRRSLRQKATWGALACIWGLYAALLLLSIPAASYSSEPLYLYYTSDKAKGWPLVDIAMTCKLADEYITQDAGRFNTLRNLPSCAEPFPSAKPQTTWPWFSTWGRVSGGPSSPERLPSEHNAPAFQRAQRRFLPPCHFLRHRDQNFRHRHVYGCGTVPPHSRSLLLH